MSRSKIKPVLLSCAIALNLGALSIAQDAPELDNNFDPSIHDVSLVPRLNGSAPVAAAERPLMKVSEQAQVYASQRPSIIVRPGVGNSGCLNECELAVEPISSSVEGRFRLKLSIPESIDIVELFPQQTGGQARKVRVLLEPVTEPPTPNASLQAKCGDECESLQTVTKDLAKSKFKANPFFLGDDSQARNNIGSATAQNNDFIPSPFHLSSARVNEFPMEAALKPAAATQLSLEAKLIGPRSLEAGASAEFEINLQNFTSTDCRDVLVQLQLPDGLEPLLLDRTAWLDAKRRTVSWKVDELKSGEREVIHYAVLTTTSGPQLQKVTVGMNGLDFGNDEIRTLVTSPFETSEELVPANTLHQEYRE